jgi:hypothetical protein
MKKIVINFENEEDYNKFLVMSLQTIKPEKGNIEEFEEEIQINIINLD